MKRAVRANGRLCFCDLRGIAGAGELSARGRHGGRGVTALTMRRTGGAGSGHAGRGMWPAIPYMAARGLSQKNKPVQSGGRRRGRAVLSRRVVRRRRAGGKPPFAQCGGNTCSGSTSSPAARGARRRVLNCQVWCEGVQIHAPVRVRGAEVAPVMRGRGRGRKNPQGGARAVRNACCLPCRRARRGLRSSLPCGARG